MFYKFQRIPFQGVLGRSKNDKLYLHLFSKIFFLNHTDVIRFRKKILTIESHECAKFEYVYFKELF